jgi:hypothetical protein
MVTPASYILSFWKGLLSLEPVRACTHTLLFRPPWSVMHGVASYLFFFFSLT